MMKASNRLETGNGGKRRSPAPVSRRNQERIVLRIATGDTLEEICGAQGMPSRETVLMFVMEDFEFRKKFEMAKAIQAEMILDGILEIADDGRGDWKASGDAEGSGFRVDTRSVRRARIRVDTGKWLIAMLRPDRYGRAARPEKEEMMPLAPLKEFFQSCRNSTVGTRPRPDHCPPPPENSWLRKLV